MDTSITEKLGEAGQNRRCHYTTGLSDSNGDVGFRTIESQGLCVTIRCQLGASIINLRDSQIEPDPQRTADMVDTTRQP